MNYYSAADSAIRSEGSSTNISWLIWSLLFYATFVVAMNFDLSPPVTGAEHFGVDDESGSFGRFRSLAILAMGGLGFLALIRGRREIGIYSPTAVFALLLLGIAVMSFLWADEVMATVRRAVTLSLVCLAAFGFARLFSFKDFQRFIILTGLITIAMGVLVEVKAGSFLVYRFGAMTNANTQGTLAAFLLITILSYGWQYWPRSRTLFLALFTLVILYLTGSRGGLGAAIVGILLWRLLEDRRPGLLITQVILGSFVLIPVLSMFIDFGATIEGFIEMGRTDVDAAEASSLTGRLPLWTFLVNEYVPQRPLLGYGLGGFWDGTHIREVSNTQDWNIVFSHSGYVDLLLDLGLLGLIAFVLALIGSIIRCIRLSRWPEWACGAALLVALAVNSVVETILLMPTLASFICLVVIAKALFFNPEPDRGEDC